MKALLVTSQVTFIPNNYDDLIIGLASSSQIGGLLVLQNRDARFLGTGLGLLAIGAHRIGATLLINMLPLSMRRRRSAFKAQKKPVWTAPSINSDVALTIIKDYGFDLVINARTRDIYKLSILQSPSLGCINIHHGLLPDQRGTMCDLWALYEKKEAGFTIHVMSEKIDDGAILHLQAVSEPGELNYAAYLKKAAKQECKAMITLLEQVENEGMPKGVPNESTKALVYRRNPTRKEIVQCRKKGIKL